MPIDIKMPALSDTMTEGTLVKWTVKEGDEIEFGDVIAEVETDKATMEMTAMDDGRIAKILLADGGKAPVGDVIAIVLEEDEDESAIGSGGGSSSAAPSESANKPEEAKPATAPAAAPPATTSSSGERIKASPLARKIAAADGIDLASVTGSGPGGRIVKKDLAGGSKAAPTAAASPAPVTTAITPTKPAPATIAAMPAGAEDQRLPLSGMRTIIAERLLLSKTTIPHFYLTVEVDAEPLMTLRKQANAAVEVTGNKFTVNDFVLKAVAGAAVAVPQVNASFDGDAIVQYGSIQLCVAIAVEDGLVTPVIRDAQTKSLLQISRAVKDLAERAKNKKLSPDEFAGGTITVSNLGAYGIESFDAIINPPQACILSISAARKTPVVDEAGNVVAGMRMKVGMSCDHRVVDGAVGAAYLAEFKKLIENPASMLV